MKMTAYFHEPTQDNDKNDSIIFTKPNEHNDKNYNIIFMNPNEYAYSDKSDSI